MHERLKDEISKTIEERKNLKDFKITANQNPFNWSRIQQNQFHQPQVPFLHNKMPPISETVRPVGIDGPYGGPKNPLGGEPKMGENPEKVLDAMKFHSPGKWDQLQKSNPITGGGPSLKKDMSKSLVENHLGYSWDPKANKLTNSCLRTVKESPLSQSAKSILDEKNNLKAAENIF